MPTSCKHLQWFLGFANFYCRFIRDYSQVATPLIQLTSHARPFHWTPEADVDFAELKRHSTPILVLPDPSWYFLRVAPHIPFLLLSWAQLHSFCPEVVLLAAHHGHRHPLLCLHNLCLQQGLPPVPSQLVIALAHP